MDSKKLCKYFQPNRLNNSIDIISTDLAYNRYTLMNNVRFLQVGVLAYRVKNENLAFLLIIHPRPC